MSFTSLRLTSLLAIATVAFVVSGCNSMPSSTATAYGAQDFTGNWSMGISDPPYPGPFPITSFTGAMAGSGQNVTAVFRASGSCVSPTQDIQFTGSQTADGTLTLTSTNLPNNSATLSAKLTGIMPAANPPAFFLGSLAVTGSGPCAMGSITLEGPEFAPLTGIYIGPITSSSGTTANFTVTLAQSAANPDGEFPESGTITVAGPTCTNTYSLTGLVTGSTYSAILTPISGPPFAATLTTNPMDEAATNLLSLSITIPGTGCNAGTFTGNLTLQ
jgi:hypothetical protein